LLSTESYTTSSEKRHFLALSNLQKKLTREGELQEAVAVQTEVKKYEPLSGIAGNALASVEVSCSAKGAKVADLKIGQPRLFRLPSATFAKIDDSLENAKFIRLGWQHKSKMHLKIVSSGTVYFISPSKDWVIKNKGVIKEASGKIGGKWIRRVHTIETTIGDEIYLDGTEATFAAGAITIKK